MVCWSFSRSARSRPWAEVSRLRAAPLTYAPSATCSTYPSRRSISSSVVRRSGPRPVRRAISVSRTPVECRDTVSRTRRASWAEWYGAVGSFFSATVSPALSGPCFGQLSFHHDSRQSACCERLLMRLVARSKPLSRNAPLWHMPKALCVRHAPRSGPRPLPYSAAFTPRNQRTALRNSRVLSWPGSLKIFSGGPDSITRPESNIRT